MPTAVWGLANLTKFDVIRRPEAKKKQGDLLLNNGLYEC
jgi:hypothetical protein